MKNPLTDSFRSHTKKDVAAGGRDVLQVILS